MSQRLGATAHWVKCHCLHSFGTNLTRVTGNEGMTHIHPEKLGSSGPCTLMEIHQQPRNLAQEMYEPDMVVHAYNTSTQEIGAGRSGVQGQLQLQKNF